MADQPLIDPAPAGTDPSALAAATAIVRAYCGWHVAPVITETLVIDGSGASRLVLPTLRVESIDALTVGGVAVADPDWSATGILYGRFPDRPRSVEVTLTHGYDVVPLELRDVVLGIASDLGDGASEGAIASKRLGDYQVTYATGDAATGATVATSARAILNRYRLNPLA